MVRSKDKIINDLVEKNILEKTFPGVEILLNKKGRNIFRGVWGYESAKREKKLTLGKIFDLASITKPLATTLAIMKLVELGEIHLEQKIGSFFSKLSVGLKGDISIRNLLTHTSGFPAYSRLFDPDIDYDNAKLRLFEIELAYQPGKSVLYSCLDFLILGELIRFVTDLPLTQFCNDQIFEPAQLKKTGFKLEYPESEFVPTAQCSIRNKYLRGQVHDENAFLFLEEGGNAGLFSNAEEMQKLVQILIDGGTYQGKTILNQESIDLMWSDWNLKLPLSWGLGWDFKRKGNGFMTCGDYFSEGSVGHVGFTGTSLWIDREKDLVAIVLSNRVNFSRNENIPKMQSFRPRIHNLLSLYANDFE